MALQVSMDVQENKACENVQEVQKAHIGISEQGVLKPDIIYLTVLRECPVRVESVGQTNKRVWRDRPHVLHMECHQIF